MCALGYTTRFYKTTLQEVERPWSEACVVRLQGGMMTSPSGNLGNQFNMGRVPSMGLGNLDSMELPDTVRPLCTQPSASHTLKHSSSAACLSACLGCQSSCAYPLLHMWKS